MKKTNNTRKKINEARKMREKCKVIPEKVGERKNNMNENDEPKENTRGDGNPERGKRGKSVPCGP